MTDSNGLGWVFITLFFAYVLAVVPLPDWLEPARPAWVPLVFLYWVIALPHRIGVMVGWTLGLFLDVVTGVVLGQNAMAMAIIAYIAYLLHLRIRVFPVWQQCLSILVIVGIYQLVTLLIQRSVSIMPWTMSYWLSSLVSALVWPWMKLLLRQVGRYADVS